MAEAGSRRDPLLAFRFAVTFDDLAPTGFSDCTGLQLETEVQEYAEGGQNGRVHRFITRTRQSNVTLRRGIAGRDLWDWYYDVTLGTMRSRNASIRIFDAPGETVVAEWQLRRAYPVKWVGPDLVATQSNLAIETLELCHRELVRIT